MFGTINHECTIDVSVFRQVEFPGSEPVVVNYGPNPSVRHLLETMRNPRIKPDQDRRGRQQGRQGMIEILDGIVCSDTISASRKGFTSRKVSFCGLMLAQGAEPLMLKTRSFPWAAFPGYEGNRVEGACVRELLAFQYSPWGIAPGSKNEFTRVLAFATPFLSKDDGRTMVPMIRLDADAVGITAVGLIHLLVRPGDLLLGVRPVA